MNEYLESQEFFNLMYSYRIATEDQIERFNDIRDMLKAKNQLDIAKSSLEGFKQALKTVNETQLWKSNLKHTGIALFIRAEKIVNGIKKITKRVKTALIKLM